jgi:DNA-binding CsgD family transcriptional regulator
VLRPTIATAWTSRPLLRDAWRRITTARGLAWRDAPDGQMTLLLDDASTAAPPRRGRTLPVVLAPTSHPRRAVTRLGRPAILVTMHDAVADLTAAADAALEGRSFATSTGVELLASLLAEDHGADVPRARERTLSDRELDVLELLLEGATAGATARRLGLAVKTVEGHRRSLYGKLGVRTRAAAAAAALGDPSIVAALRGVDRGRTGWTGDAADV